MYQKKEYIYSETMGVCLVEDIVKLSPVKNQTMLYYVLRSIKEKDKIAYIPVENHSVKLRNLVTLVEAKKKKEESYEKANLLEKQEIDFVIEKYDN